MAVVIETTLGDLTVDLFTEERPNTCMNFLKLCKIKYYNFCLFHSIQHNFIAQTGDPTGSGKAGESVFGKLHGENARYYEAELLPKLRHDKPGLMSMVNCGNNLLGSQFFLTLSSDLHSLDGQHCVFGEVVEGHEVLRKLNEAICDADHRPYQDIRITHTIILEDPYDDPPGLSVPDSSPVPSAETLANGRIAPDEELDETQGRSAAEVEEMVRSREAKAQATILEIVGDLPDAEVAPPENVLFVCKLNPVTSDDDLEIIFSRFGKVKSCEVIRDKKSGDSLQYAFVEFEDRKACEDAYFKMDNVLIDDRRIHVDFSQSVSKLHWKGRGRLEHVGNRSDGLKEDDHNHKYSEERRKDIGHQYDTYPTKNVDDSNAQDLTNRHHDHHNSQGKRREENTDHQRRALESSEKRISRGNSHRDQDGYRRRDNSREKSSSKKVSDSDRDKSRGDRRRCSSDRERSRGDRRAEYSSRTERHRSDKKTNESDRDKSRSGRKADDSDRDRGRSDRRSRESELDRLRAGDGKRMDDKSKKGTTATEDRHKNGSDSLDRRRERLNEVTEERVKDKEYSHRTEDAIKSIEIERPILSERLLREESKDRSDATSTGDHIDKNNDVLREESKNRSFSVSKDEHKDKISKDESKEITTKISRDKHKDSTERGSRERSKDKSSKISEHSKDRFRNDTRSSKEHYNKRDSKVKEVLRKDDSSQESRKGKKYIDDDLGKEKQFSTNSDSELWKETDLKESQNESIYHSKLLDGSDSNKINGSPERVKNRREVDHPRDRGTSKENPNNTSKISTSLDTEENYISKHVEQTRAGNYSQESSRNNKITSIEDVSDRDKSRTEKRKVSSDHDSSSSGTDESNSDTDQSSDKEDIPRKRKLIDWELEKKSEGLIVESHSNNFDPNRKHKGCELEKEPEKSLVESNEKAITKVRSKEPIAENKPKGNDGEIHSIKRKRPKEVPSQIKKRKRRIKHSSSSSGSDSSNSSDSSSESDSSSSDYRSKIKHKKNLKKHSVIAKKIKRKLRVNKRGLKKKIHKKKHSETESSSSESSDSSYRRHKHMKAKRRRKRKDYSSDESSSEEESKKKRDRKKKRKLLLKRKKVPTSDYSDSEDDSSEHSTDVSPKKRKRKMLDKKVKKAKKLSEKKKYSAGKKKLRKERIKDSSSDGESEDMAVIKHSKKKLAEGKKNRKISGSLDTSSVQC
ncbi:unnamed protein product [Timema podura]|uniref:peptidylprolyl isomerase n=1 Tax=Timema podura TaxID=61482 RepID=A0ABN7NKK1_TIMPD|nr:unnamed protein product [Timema podura]